MRLFFFRLCFTLLVLLTGMASGEASPLVLSTVQRFGGRIGLGGGVGGAPKPQTVTLRRKSPGIVIETTVEYIGQVPVAARPRVFATVTEPNGFGDTQYGTTKVKGDGSFSIKVPLESQSGNIQIAGEGFRFVGSTEFTVKDGQVRFAAPLQIEAACRLTVHVQVPEGTPAKSIKGQFLKRRFRPCLGELWKRPTSAKARATRKTGETQVYGPLLPMDNGWIVVDCEGYATAQKRIPEQLLQWGSDAEITITLEPEFPVALEVQLPDGVSAEGAILFVAHQEYAQMGRKVPLPAAGELVHVPGLSAGSYYTLVEGQGLLPSDGVLELGDDSQASDGRSLRINPGLGVVGRVLSTGGAPVAGAKVWIRPVTDKVEAMLVEDAWRVDDGGFNPNCEWTGKTDSLGRFDLTGFERAKSFEVLVKAPPANDSIPEGLSKIKKRRYRRDNISWSNVSGVAPGLAPIEIRLDQNAEGVLANVVNDQGQLLLGCKVRAYADCDGPLLEDQLASQSFDPDLLGPVLKASEGSVKGRFQFPTIKGGKWTLLVSKSGFADQVVRAVGPGSEALDIVLTRLGSISGSIADMDDWDGTGAELFLVDRDGQATNHPVTKDFVVEDIIPGSYTAVLNVPDIGMGSPQTIEIRPAETYPLPQLKLLPNGSIRGQMSSSLLSLPLEIRLFADSVDPVLFQVGLPRRGVKPDDAGAFSLTDVFPGNYWLGALYHDSEQPKARLGTGYYERVEVLPGEEIQVDYGPVAPDLDMQGSVRIDEGPLANGWICLEALSFKRVYFAPTDSEGHYHIWAPSGTTYRVYAYEGVRGMTPSHSHWLAEQWTSPEGSAQVDWTVPGGAVKIEWVDEDGQPIQWIQIPGPAAASWYPDNSSPKLANSAVVPHGGQISRLLPGGSYRIRIEGNSLFGDLFQARDVRFQVPTDGTIPSIRIPCLTYQAE